MICVTMMIEAKGIVVAVDSAQRFACSYPAGYISAFSVLCYKRFVYIYISTVANVILCTFINIFWRCWLCCIHWEERLVWHGKNCFGSCLCEELQTLPLGQAYAHRRGHLVGPNVQLCEDQWEHRNVIILLITLYICLPLGYGHSVLSCLVCRMLELLLVRVAPISRDWGRM